MTRRIVYRESFVAAFAAVTVGALVGASSGQITPLRTEAFAFVPALATADSRVGSSVAIANGVGVVGNFANADSGVFSQGVYTFDAATGTPGVTLVPDMPGLDSGFGFSVSALGDAVAVAAPLVTGFDQGPDGAVVLFDGSSGVATGVLPRPSGGRELYGWASAITADSIIVGAPVAGDANLGLVRVFDRATGALVRELTPDDPTVATGFGFSVAAANGRVVVGAPFGSDDGARGGSVYVFDEATGTQLAKLRRAEPEVGDEFGWALALSGDRLAVSAPFAADSAGDRDGVVSVYDLATFSLERELEADMTAPEIRFGDALALDGDRLVVGAVGQAGGGAAGVFDVMSGEELLRLTPSDGAVGDDFGASVAIEGTTVLVGAPFRDAAGVDTGVVYMFDASVPCSAADLVPTFGVVDLDDADAFIDAFLVGDPAVDFAPNFGVVDLDDVNAFITSFLAGCP